MKVTAPDQGMVISRMAGEPDGNDKLPPAEELEVINLVASGLHDYAIARRLGISIVTVRRRVASLRNRLGATTRAEAIAKAAVRGWLEGKDSAD